jgi:hypothetical protein
MKRWSLAALCCLLCSLPVLAMAGENPWQKKLPFASATVHYTLSGTQEGTEDRYFRDYGRESATYRRATTVMMGMKIVSDTIEIQDGDWLYTYDLQEKTGTKTTNPQKFMAEEFDKLTAAEKKQVEKNAETMGTGFMKGMNGKIEQNVTKILGYSCDRTSVMGSTIYMIHGTPIPLKTEMDMAGMKMASLATSFEEGKADARFFEQPAGIEAVHDQQDDQMAREMAAQMMAMLKDPDGVKKMSQQQPMMPGPGQGMDDQENQQMMEQAGELMKGLLGK